MKRARILPVCLALPLALVLSLGTADGLWAGTAVQLSLSDATAVAGDQAEVLLSVDQGASVAGVQATILNFDPSVLSNPRVAAGDGANGHVAYSNVPSPGELRMVVYNPVQTNVFNGANANAASILFDVDDAAAGGTVVNLALDPAGSMNVSHAAASDAAGNSLSPVTVSDGSVTIVTSPRWYFAEGDTRSDPAIVGPYSTFLLIVNPSLTETANLTLEIIFDETSGLNPLTVQQNVGPQSRFTFNIGTVLAANSIAPQGFGMRLVSDNDVPVFAERAMYWIVGAGVGRSAGTDTIGARELATEWFLAEGTTTGGRETQITIANPTNANAEVDVTYLIEGGSPTTIRHTIQAKRRETIRAGGTDAITNVSFSTQITSFNGVPVVVERTLLGIANGVQNKWGHGELGITEPSNIWLFAEGAVHSSFETFILLANANDQPVNATLRFLPQDRAEVSHPVTIAANSRLTVNVELNVPAMADSSGFSTEVTTQNNELITAERAIFFRTGIFSDRSGATVAAGNTASQARWFLPEGGIFGPSGFEAFVLIGNPNATDSNCRVSFLQPAGAPVETNVVVPAGGRFTVRANNFFNDPGGTLSFSTVVETTNGVNVVTERAMFWTDGTAPRIEGHASRGIPN